VRCITSDFAGKFAIWKVDSYSLSAVVIGCRVVATLEEACAAYMVPVTTFATSASVEPHADLVQCRWRSGRFGLNRFINRSCDNFTLPLNQRPQFLVEPFEMRQDLVGGAGWYGGEKKS
jgi:hypothetical protein